MHTPLLFDAAERGHSLAYRLRSGAFLLLFLVLGLLMAASSTATAQTLNYVSEFPGIGNPTGLSLDTIGGVTYLYVSDHNGGRVFKYNLGTGERTQIGSYGAGDGQFVWPDSIGIDPVTHDLYIADRQLHRVTRLTHDGRFVMKWGGNGPITNRFGHAGAGTAPGQFNGPQGVVVDAQGNVYITEHENHRVQKFRVTQTGGVWTAEPLAMWGSGGSGPGQFNTPYGITLDGAGNVWVADGYNSRVQKFTPNGELLGQVVVRGASEPHLVCTWVTVDAAGDFYVSVTSDPFTGGVIQNQRVEKFSAAGVSLAKWGTYGAEAGNFRLPFGSAIDRTTNRMYIADWDNGRVQVFSLGSSTGPVPPTGPTSRTAAIGANLNLTTTAPAGSTYQWRFNGSAIGGATSATLALNNFQPANAGLYTTAVSTAGSTLVTNPAVIGVVTSAKVTSGGSEVRANVVHPNTNVYDQVLLEGTAASITADPGQVTRLSYVDLSNDIVQVEFSGAGTLTLTLDADRPPARPENYNQDITYRKGHANIVITGANETTNVAVFSVGRANAVDQGLFRAGVAYDGWADLGSISILSTNEKFGGLFAGDAVFSSSQGHTGILAPGITFTGRVAVGDIHASNDATPTLLLGSAADVRVAGGNLEQLNNRAVQVSGFSQLKFTAGADSHDRARAAQANRARLEQDGADVSSRAVTVSTP